MALLDNENIWVREGAVAGLEKLQDREIIPALIKALKDEHETVRYRAAMAFDNIASYRKNECIDAIDDLIQCLKDTNPDSRFHAAQALWKIGDTNKATTPLINMLWEEEKPNIRMTAARALGKANAQNNWEVIEVLLSTLNDPDLGTRICSAEALGEIAEPEVISTLQGLSLEVAEDYLDSTIAAIQNRCKFYNYKIWQEAIQNEKLELKNGEQGTVVGETTNIFNIDTLNAPNGAINLGGTIYGAQLGTQSH